MMALDLAAEVEFERLTTDNATEIAELLNATWPTLYGETGCIVFNEAYLKWLYGGPDQHNHFIRGLRVDGKLMVVEAALYRPLSDGNTDWDAHLATHLAISPDLSLMMRVAVASKISEALKENLVYEGLSIAFFEKAKGLVSTTKNIAKDKSSQLVEEFVFSQAIANARRVQMVADTASGITIRPAQDTDMSAVQDLIRNTDSALYLNSGEDALWYHYSQAPEALCLVAEREEKVVGFLSTYVLDWAKGDQVTRNVVAETILGDQPEILAALLNRALEQVKSVGARGIVFDNISYLDEDTARDAGILPIPKEMVFVTRGAKEPPKVGTGFLIDVK